MASHCDHKNAFLLLWKKIRTKLLCVRTHWKYSYMASLREENVSCQNSIQFGHCGFRIKNSDVLKRFSPLSCFHDAARYIWVKFRIECQCYREEKDCSIQCKSGQTVQRQHCTMANQKEISEDEHRSEHNGSLHTWIRGTVKINISETGFIVINLCGVHFKLVHFMTIVKIAIKNILIIGR